jgi:hypothetical protein
MAKSIHFASKSIGIAVIPIGTEAKRRRIATNHTKNVKKKRRFFNTKASESTKEKREDSEQLFFITPSV